MRDRDEWVSDLSTPVLRSPPHKSRGFFHRLCLHSHPKVFTSCTIFSPCTVLTPISDQRIHTEVFSEIARRCNAHFLSLFLSKFGVVVLVVAGHVPKIYTTCTNTSMVWIRTQKTRFHVFSLCLHIGKRSDMYQIYQISVKRSEMSCLCKHEMFQAIILTKLFKNSILFYTLRPTLFNSSNACPDRQMRVQTDK